jgi:hypothetical protein
MSDVAGAVEAVSKHFNSAELTEGRMLRKLLREVGPYCNDVQFRVLMFIFDRTYTYGKTSEVIPMRHFTDGVRLGSGELLHPPIRRDRATIYRAIDFLVDNVIILRSQRSRSDSPTFAINPVWMPKVSQQCDKGVAAVRQETRVNATHNTNEYNIDDTTQVALRASAREEDEMESARDRLLATVAGATEKSKAARAKTKNKQNATGLMKIWEDAFITIHPEETYFRWRVFEQSAFKKAVERGVPAGSVEEFIIFCVTAFDNVINEHFSWMKSKPTIPAVGFVTKHIAEFYQSFNDSKDPNRKLRGRIKRETTNGKAPLADRPKGTATADQAEVERLRAENAALKAKVGAKAGSRRLKLKRRIEQRPDSDPEFGSWD